MFTDVAQSLDRFDDFCSHSARGISLHMASAVERDDAMCFQLDYRGVGPARLVEGGYIGCAKCSGSLGFRDGTTNAEANTAADNCYGHFEGAKRHSQNNRAVTVSCVCDDSSAQNALQ